MDNPIVFQLVWNKPSKEIDVIHNGRGVIRIDDKTDHGGQVISASSGTTVMCMVAALQDDMTQCLKCPKCPKCPKCKGNFAIKPGGAGARHEGKPYAYDGDVTECGARLMTSL